MRASSVNSAILDVLSNDQTHLTAHQVYEAIIERLPAVNSSTVYRSLERLVKNGDLSVSDMGTGALVYERVCLHNHHHLVCQKCGTVLTISDQDVAAFFNQLEKQHGFEIATNHLVLFGTCPVCHEN